MLEAVDVLKGLWSNEPFSFTGDHYSIRDLEGTPVPCQPGGPPIYRRWRQKSFDGSSPTGRHSGAQCLSARGSVGPETALSALGNGFRTSQLGEEAAGDRFAQIELQMNTFMTAVTSSTSEAEEMFNGMAPMFGLTPEQAKTIPMVLAGTVNDVCEQLERYRDQYEQAIG